MSFLGQKVQQSKPPDKGSFPLDRSGACKPFKEAFMACLKANKNDNGACRLESKAYLECRMENELMAKEDFRKLGFGDVVNMDTPGGAGAKAGEGGGQPQ